MQVVKEGEDFPVVFLNRVGSEEKREIEGETEKEKDCVKVGNARKSEKGSKGEKATYCCP